MRKKGSGLSWFRFLTLLVLAALIPAFSAPGRVYASSSERVNVIVPVSYKADNVDVVLQCKLEYEENENQIITDDTLTLKDGEEGSFFITYTAVGNYYCQIHQIKGTADNVVYDEHIIYLATSVIMDTDGKLSANAVLYEDGSDKLPSAYFINYEETETPDTEETEVVTEFTEETEETEPETETETEPPATPTTEPEPTTTPTTTTTTETTGGNTPVKTADGTPAAEPYVLLMLLAAFAAAAALAFRKRGNER